MECTILITRTEADSAEGLRAEIEVASHRVVVGECACDFCLFPLLLKLDGCTGAEGSATTDLVGSMDLRAAASADLVGLRPITDPAMASDLQPVGIVESSASTKEGTRVRRNEEGTDDEDDDDDDDDDDDGMIVVMMVVGCGCGCGSTVCMLPGARAFGILLVGLVHPS